ncbi:MBOAT family O-acyltransferase [Flavonifractor hominis]|uniref:MBOAT family O-acyltransferase n=1 Tax=Flavonifractor hominis TaxID=3133178 RepID=A0ABV1EP56_9FIRM
MTFLSLSFFCFFPITAVVYFCLPRRMQNPWLLLASWFFYLCAKPVYLTLLLFVVVSSYLAGLALARRRSRWVLALCLTADVVLLFLFKYVNFALSLAGRLLNAAGVDFSAPVLELVLPVGISFYLFQAMGYVIDVYRGKAEVERDFVVYALFLSFFPQVVSGPIGRAGQLIPQFRRAHTFEWTQFRAGLVRFLWGAFKKMVLADRLAVLVNTVFGAPQQFGALQLAGAAVAFSFQIYCDFSAYSDMALGVARSMGFSLLENFRTPYFSRSIAEFWRRWHISLSSWFRDYLYIPLGGSRRGTLRKYLNVLIVFTVSGLWHGAAMTFVVWGALNGLYQVAGAVTAPLRTRVWSCLHQDEDSVVRHLTSITVTFLLSTVAWVFFKAGSLTNALAVLSGMLHGPLWVFQSMGLDRQELLVAAVGLLVLFLVDLRWTGHDPVEDYLAAPRLVRWVILWTLLLACLVFGSYGTGYDAQAFLYGFSF